MSASDPGSGRGARRSPHAAVAWLCFCLLAMLADPAHTQAQTRTLDHQGVAREYIVANAGREPRPLMMVLHGRRGAGEPNRSSPLLDALAVREGFAVVYPAGIGGVWNWPTRIGTAELPLGKAGDVAADDIGFLARLLDRLISEQVADPVRIYVSGASMGGFMTFGMMCTMSTRIAAAAALIATMSEAQLKACEPRRAVPLAMLAGTRDEIVPYAGRNTGGVRLMPAQDTLMFWSDLHGCTGLTGTKMPRGPREQPINTVRLEGTGCKTTGALSFYRVDGGGHTLPSRRSQGEDELKRFGPRSNEFETSEEVWAFVKRFRL